MRSWLTWLACGVASTAAGSGLAPVPGHSDLVLVFDTVDEVWEDSIVADIGTFATTGSYFPGYDGDFLSGLGERFPRLAGDAEWGFLGVAEDEPVWIFPEIPSYGTQTEPGFEDTQTGVFTDKLRVTLAGVDGPAGGHFSLFDSGGTYMASADGIDASDVLVKPDSHSHFNWAFSKLGMWRVRLQVFGYRGPGQTDPTPISEEIPVHFAIGGLARWRAGNFDAATVMEESIAGMAADPDRDRLVNLIECMLGGHPRDGSATASVHGGRVAPEAGRDAGKLTVSFHRPVSPEADPGAVVAIEWADDFDGPWEEGGVEIGTAPAANGWERVTFRDEEGGTCRFGRVVVTELP